MSQKNNSSSGCGCFLSFLILALVVGFVYRHWIGILVTLAGIVMIIIIYKKRKAMQSKLKQEVMQREWEKQLKQRKLEEQAIQHRIEEQRKLEEQVIQHRIEEQRKLEEQEKQREEWFRSQQEQIKEALQPYIKAAEAAETALLQDIFFVNGKFLENIPLFHSLEEHFTYLNTLESKLFELYCHLLLTHGYSVSTIENLESLKQSLSTLLHQESSKFRELLNTVKSNTIEANTIEAKTERNVLHLQYEVLERYFQSIQYSAQDYLDSYFSRLKYEKHNIQAGIDGEQKLKKELELFSDLWKTFYNLWIEHEGMTAESDALVIAKQGVFSIEAKNFAASGSYMIRVTKDGQWLKLSKDGSLEPMEDVMSQVNRHIGTKQRFLNRILSERYPKMEYIRIDSIIVIANDTVRVENESNNVILRTSQVAKYILDRSAILSPEQIEEITEVFQTHQLNAKKFPHPDYLTNLELFLQTIFTILSHVRAIGEAHEAYCKYLQKHGM